MQLYRIRSTAIVALLVLPQLVPPSAWAQSDDRDALSDLSQRLHDHFAAIEKIEGALVVNCSYSDMAVDWVAGRDADRAMEADPERPPTWSKRGAVYCDFWISGRKWNARATRLLNSGFNEMAVPGHSQGEAAPPEWPEHPWSPPAVWEWSDGEIIFRHDYRSQRAGVRQYKEGEEWSRMPRQVYDALMESRAAGSHAKMLERLGQPQAVTRTQESGADDDVWRLSWRTGDDGRCRATYWIAQRGTDVTLVKYDDFWLREDGFGYRQVGEVRQVVELPNGRRIPSEVVTWRFEYHPGELEPWHSTSVMRLLDLKLHHDDDLKLNAWRSLPPGTFIQGMNFLYPTVAVIDTAGGPITMDVQGDFVDRHDLPSLRFEALTTHANPPPFPDGLGRPVDDELMALHARPCELGALPPQLRE